MELLKKNIKWITELVFIGVVEKVSKGITTDIFEGTFFLVLAFLWTFASSSQIFKGVSWEGLKGFGVNSREIALQNSEGIIEGGCQRNSEKLQLFFFQSNSQRKKIS